MKDVQNSKELYSKCHIWDFQCVRKFGLKEHIQSMHCDVTKACNYCDYVAKSKTSNDLQKHVLTSHEGIELNCRFCAFTFTSLDTINSHKKTVPRPKVLQKIQGCNQSKSSRSERS